MAGQLLYWRDRCDAAVEGPAALSLLLVRRPRLLSAVGRGVAFFGRREGHLPFAFDPDPALPHALDVTEPASEISGEVVDSKGARARRQVCSPTRDPQPCIDRFVSPVGEWDGEYHPIRRSVPPFELAGQWRKKEPHLGLVALQPDAAHDEVLWFEGMLRGIVIDCHQDDPARHLARVIQPDPVVVYEPRQVHLRPLRVRQVELAPHAAVDGSVVPVGDDVSPGADCAIPSFIRVHPHGVQTDVGDALYNLGPYVAVDKKTAAAETWNFCLATGARARVRKAVVFKNILGEDVLAQRPILLWSDN